MEIEMEIAYFKKRVMEYLEGRMNRHCAAHIAKMGVENAIHWLMAERVRRCFGWWKYQRRIAGDWMARMRPRYTPLCIQYVCADPFCVRRYNHGFHGLPKRDYYGEVIYFAHEGPLCENCGERCAWRAVGAYVSFPHDGDKDGLYTGWTTDEYLDAVGFSNLHQEPWQFDRNVWYIPDHAMEEHGDDILKESFSRGGMVQFFHRSIYTSR